MSDGRKRKVLVLCPYPVGLAPSQRLKYEQYFKWLESRGFSIEVSPFFSVSAYRILYGPKKMLQKFFWTLLGYARRTIDLWRLPSYDLVYIHLWVTPLGPPFFEYLCARRNQHILYDVDDMISIAPTTLSNRIVSRLKGRGKMFFLIKAARQVIVCTPGLAELALKLNPRVTDISSTVDTEIYLPVNRYQNSEAKIVLGWSGSHSTSRFLRLLHPVLSELRQRLDFKLLIMGDPTCRFDDLDCESLPWSESSEVPTLQRIDIGLYPLPLDDPWVHGKSGLKAIQYMALGIPTVATAVGANFRVIEDGISGILARTASDWVDAILRLSRDPQLRERLGRAARQRVVERFSVVSNQNVYEDLLNRAARR